MIYFIVLGVLVVDFTGFIAWGLSGQVPQDGFYIGRITAEIIGLFIS